MPVIRSARLRRREAARFLTEELGIPCSVASLAKFACKSSEPHLGPPFVKWGGTVLYEKAELERWANNRLSKPITNTRELELGDL